MIEHYETSTEFVGLTEPQIHGPMGQHEQDLEYLQGVIDQKPGIRTMNLPTIIRLAQRGLVTLAVEPTPLAAAILRARTGGHQS